MTRSSRQLSGIALTIVFQLQLASESTHALTRNWDRGDGIGGLYSTDNNWLPSGEPRPEDDVRFNDTSINPIEILFIQDQIATDLHVENGDIKFLGSATKTYDLDNVQIDSLGDLSVGNAFGDFPDRFLLDVTNHIEVTGGLMATDGARITADTVNADGPTFTNPAEITLVGENSIGTPSLLDVSALILGDTRRGNLTVQAGAKAQIASFMMDAGDILVTGLGVSGTPSSLTVYQNANLGVTGLGDVRVLQGGELITQDVYLGNNSPVTISGSASGSRSKWSVARTLTVNTSDISVSNGAEFISGATNIASGDLLVTGPGTTWSTTGLFDMMYGAFELENGASVSSEDAHIGRVVTARAAVTGSSSPSSITSWNNSGDLSIGGNPADGDNGSGSLEISGLAQVDVSGTLKIFDRGTVYLQTTSVLIASRIENNGGEFNFLGGTLQTEHFAGDLSNQGGTLDPGGEDLSFTTIDGDYTQLPGGVLALGVAGSSPGDTHDVVTVLGEVQLDGLLELSLVDGFIPNSANQFTLLAATSGLSGFFDNVASGQRLETIDGGGSFVVNYGIGSAFDEDRIVLSDFQRNLMGDFDRDGDVDGSDFLVWQRNPSLGDLSEWQNNYGAGATLSLATAPSQAVPEPTTLLLMMISLGFIGLGSRNSAISARS